MTLRLGFALSPTWLRGDFWRRSDSDVENMFSLAPYAAIARAAEEASLDFLFVPDAGYLDAGVIEHTPGFSTLDSHTLVSALAAVTARIRLVPTVQTAFASPYTTARQLQSLHRLSGGRAGWNAVTALGGHENHGLGALPDSATRYARAAEFVRVVTQLWESFPAAALVADREAGRFADPDLVRPIGFHGEHFRVAGPLSVPAHPAGRPPLFQAGASPSGVAFAGATADAVFGCAPDVAAAIAQRTALRAAAVHAGRSPDGIRFLPGFSFVLADSRRDAEALAGDRAGGGGPPHWTVVGTPDDAIEAIRSWAAAGAIDGIIALAGGSRESIRLFFDHVAPALRRRPAPPAGP